MYKSKTISFEDKYGSITITKDCDVGVLTVKITERDDNFEKQRTAEVHLSKDETNEVIDGLNELHEG